MAWAPVPGVVSSNCRLGMYENPISNHAPQMTNWRNIISDSLNLRAAEVCAGGALDIDSCLRGNDQGIPRLYEANERHATKKPTGMTVGLKKISESELRLWPQQLS
jgi:hypothetical protein